jgi:hypothetical protein
MAGAAAAVAPATSMSLAKDALSASPLAAHLVADVRGAEAPQRDLVDAVCKGAHLHHDMEVEVLAGVRRAEPVRTRLGAAAVRVAVPQVSVVGEGSPLPAVWFQAGVCPKLEMPGVTCSRYALGYARFGQYLPSGLFCLPHSAVSFTLRHVCW